MTREEIFSTLHFLPLGKSPGPDGFNVEFFKFFWEDLGDYLVKAISQFFSSSTMPRSWGKTFVTLIPKKDHLKKVSDFRPISLCNVCYKIITKILANRLKLVLNNLISREQSGFIPARTPLDSIIVVQKIAHSINQDKSSPPRMIFKVDIEKAYDTLPWNAALATLARMGFLNIWISWIRACFTSVSYSLIINGEPTKWITPARGVCQRDPLSPYLFIIVAQILSNILNKACLTSIIPGFNRSLSYNFNHLMYANDLIIITTATRRSARNINLCLAIYASLSRQNINVSKS